MLSFVHLRNLRTLSFNSNRYLVDESGDIPKILWQPTVEEYVPPRVVDKRMKYHGTENVEAMDPVQKRRYQAAIRMRRMHQNRAAAEMEYVWHRSIACRFLSFSSLLLSFRHMFHLCLSDNLFALIFKLC